MKILGIDPGYDRIGWAVVDKSDRIVRFVDAGLIQTKKQDDLSARLLQLSRDLEAIIEHYHPDTAIVEELFFANNQKTVIAVAQARGVIVTTIAQAKVNFFEYTPLQVKAIVASDGRADKKAVEKMVRLQLSGIPAKLVDDTLDAVAIALAFAVDKQYG